MGVSSNILWREIYSCFLWIIKQLSLHTTLLNRELKIKCERVEILKFSKCFKTHFTKADSYLFGSIVISKQTLIPSLLGADCPVLNRMIINIISFHHQKCSSNEEHMERGIERVSWLDSLSYFIIPSGNFLFCGLPLSFSRSKKTLFFFNSNLKAPSFNWGLNWKDFIISYNNSRTSFLFCL